MIPLKWSCVSQWVCWDYIQKHGWKMAYKCSEDSKSSTSKKNLPHCGWWLKTAKSLELSAQHSDSVYWRKSPFPATAYCFYNFGEEPWEFCNFLSLSFINILNPVSHLLPCRSGYVNPEEETTSQGIHISPVWIILNHQGIVRKYLLQIVWNHLQEFRARKHAFKIGTVFPGKLYP